MIRSIFLFIFFTSISFGATIAIIDTGFDLDHDYLKPKILKKETDEEAIDFHGWDFFDNSHLKKPVVEDKNSLNEILRYRDLRAKGHKQGLNQEEFEWFKNKSADKSFMEKVRLFKKHSHGTFVAGIALREGENISIFPIRGLNIPNPVVMIEDKTSEGMNPPKGKTLEEKFQDEINQSIERVSRKFSKICRFIANKKIEIVNASYGITYKSIMTKFRERYKEMLGKEIEETKLKILVDDYFSKLYTRSEKTMKRYPNILFVFSAGNSGIDNDIFHHYPSRIKVDNAITVAAMNGEFLATFSNFGNRYVDIGAPGVAILSLVPKVYSENGNDLYSPSSGTSMAAPYVSNLAAQIKNTNSKLTPAEIKRIILSTGEYKDHLKTKLTSGSIIDNQNALKAALLSKDFNLDQAISLGSSGVVPVEDKISFGIAPALSPEEIQQKVMETFPSVITPQEVEEEPTIGEDPTKSLSSEQKDLEKGQLDSLKQPLLKAPKIPEKSSDLSPSNQNGEQSPKPSEDVPASSFEPQPSLPENQSPTSSPSLPQ
jgi:subtilisin family serine protease